MSIWGNDYGRDDEYDECYNCASRDIASVLHVDGYGRAAFCGDCHGPYLRERTAVREAAQKRRVNAEVARLVGAAKNNGGDES